MKLVLLNMEKITTFEARLVSLGDLKPFLPSIFWGVFSPIEDHRLRRGIAIKRYDKSLKIDSFVNL
jgi:hypothetical protein